MRWEKKGLVFSVKNLNEWMQHSAIQPTAIVLDNVIRVFAGFRTNDGIARIGYVDLDAENPSIVLDYTKKPVLYEGLPGCFDDNGVSPCCVIQDDEDVYLFYSGYNIGKHVRFTSYSGLAVSHDHGRSFQRYSSVPIMERTENERLFRCVFDVLKEGSKYKVYYCTGNEFLRGNGDKTLASYKIKCLETEDFTNLQREGISLMDTNEDEYRLGRASVWKEGNKYKMYFCGGGETIQYKLAYAESENGIDWVRMDEKLNLKLSETGWDSEMMAYPSVVKYKKKTYLFYNGNNFGYDGFGYAEMVED